MRRALWILLFVLLSQCRSFAQNADPCFRLPSVDSREVESQVAFLSSDVLRGRLVGSEQSAIAAQYIESVMQGYGYSVERQSHILDSIQTKKGRQAIGRITNLTAKLVGRDTTRTVIVGAHYDHLGVDPSGDVYNGADDNASGVVAVMQIAQAMAQSGVEAGCNVIFAFFDAEEFGALGSKHYARAACAASVNITYYMNFDMVGRNSDQSRPEMFFYLYTDKNSELQRWLSDAISLYSLSLDPIYRPWDDPTTGSDNSSFAAYGIPIAWFHTDAHPDYHRVSDTYQKINYPKLCEIIRAATVVVHQMSL